VSFPGLIKVSTLTGNNLRYDWNLTLVEAREMAENKIMQRCDLCDQERQMGPHIYELRKLSLYGIFVCSEHIEANHDGWAPMFEDRLLARLRANGESEPARLKNTLLPVGL
jgi:hypothetical protein